MTGLLEPGNFRATGVVSDAAVLRAMVEVEVAWLRVLASQGLVNRGDVNAVADASERANLGGIARAAEGAGNPVVPLVAWLRSIAPARLAASVHRGLTSQDVVDTALMLVARDALRRVGIDLSTTADTLSDLADRHRSDLMAGRTLTQHAVPITFGLKAARWLSGVLDALDDIDRVLSGLPVQCGGAAGTLSLAATAGDPILTAEAFASEVELVWPGLPWHTARRPVTRIGDVAVSVLDAVGVIANDVALLGRPEFGEVREGAAPGRGGSSTMPHKQNPVLAVLIKSAAMQGPFLGAQLHSCAAHSLDERSDGAWHAEWPTLTRLLTLAVTAASQAAELVAGLTVDAGVMRQRVATEPALLAESAGVTDASEYLGAAGDFVEAALRRAEDRR